MYNCSDRTYIIIVQAEVAKFEEEKKKLQDIIKTQDDKLNKAREDLKQSEESNQAITKENYQLKKELEDSHTYKV